MIQKYCLRKKTVLFGMCVFLILFITACGSSNSTSPATQNISGATQPDLTGTWNIHVLQTGSTNKWDTLTATFDSSGNGTLSSCLDSTGGTSCPAGTLQLNIDGSGVISGSVASTNLHMTMTSNKNFIAGTSNDSATPPNIFAMWIMQKVTGTPYSSSDIQGKSFVFHSLMVGGTNQWAYGAGNTDANGVVTISSEIDPSGNNNEEEFSLGTLSVDGNGFVTLNTDTSFNGFLSDDKKTIVVTNTDSNGNYNLMIIQITGKTYTAGPIPAATLTGHLLACGDFNYWIHYTLTVASGGGMTYSDWVSSSNVSASAPTGTYTGHISSSGNVTVAGADEASYNGQLSDDETFVVGTDTQTGSNTFQLIVLTR